MKLIILCAGVGSRLSPYTSDKPKSLVKVDNKSLLSRQLDIARRFDLDIHLVGGYRYEQLSKYSKNLTINDSVNDCKFHHENLKL